MSLKRLLLGLLVAVGGLIALVRSALPPSPPASSLGSRSPQQTPGSAGLPRSQAPRPLPLFQGRSHAPKLVLSQIHRRPRTLLIRPTSRPLHHGQPFLAPGSKLLLGAASRPAILPKPVCDIVVLVEGMT